MVFENVNFYDMMDWFENIGGFDIILPFLLIFSISFAVLQNIKIFGGNKRVNVILSLVLAFFLVIQENLVLVIQDFLPRVSMIILVLFMLLLVVGIFSGGSEFSGGLLTFAAIISVILVLWAIGVSLGWSVPLADWFTEQDIAVLIVVGVFILVIWLIVREPKSGGSFGKWWSDIGNALKGKS